MELKTMRKVRIAGDLWDVTPCTIGGDLINLCREIVKDHSAEVMGWDFNGEQKTLLIDAFSAGMVVAVADNLSEKNQAKLKVMEAIIALDTCLKVYAKLKGHND